MRVVPLVSSEDLKFNTFSNWKLENLQNWNRTKIWHKIKGLWNKKLTNDKKLGTIQDHFMTSKLLKNKFFTLHILRGEKTFLGESFTIFVHSRKLRPTK